MDKKLKIKSTFLIFLIIIIIFLFHQNLTGFTIIGKVLGKCGEIPGDVNGDGEVNGIDVARILDYVENKRVWICKETADVNGDGKIDREDAIHLSKNLISKGKTPLLSPPQKSFNPVPWFIGIILGIIVVALIVLKIKSKI